MTDNMLVGLEAGTNTLWPSISRSKRNFLMTTETRNSPTGHSRASNQFSVSSTATKKTALNKRQLSMLLPRRPCGRDSKHCLLSKGHGQ